MGFETECLKEVARLRKENKVLKEILMMFMDSAGNSGSENYGGIRLLSIKDVEDMIKECADDGCGITYVISGKDELENKEFKDYVCFGYSLREIAGLHQDRLDRKDRIFNMDTEQAIKYLKDNGFKIAVTW